MLQPLADVGLEYVRLGQPVPTLSGGEAQRLKLAGYLAEAARSGISTAKVAKKGSLFLFDEPTTGLHFDDIAKLMRALRKLLAAGHSLIVIEHNLDVIRAADWLIDLGPEGGDAGGLVIGVGTPQDLMANPASHTGAALRDYEVSILPADVVVSSDIDAQEAEQAGLTARIAEPTAAYGAGEGTPLQSVMRKRRQDNMAIEIRNAREHNLKTVNVEIPRGKFNVVTGVSGSGKSTLAFDILFNEGQRRYLESLNAYARSIVQPAGRPEVDAVCGIPPTVAIEQRLSRGGRKRTVATTTEVRHFLRLLYVKLGMQHCADDGNVAVEPQNTDQIVARLLRERKGEHIGLLAPLVVNRKGVYTDLAKWAKERGHTHLRVDGEFLPAVAPWPRLDRFKEHTIELPVGDVVVDPANEAELRAAVKSALEHGKGVMSVVWPVDKLHEALNSELQQQHFSVKRACPSCGTSYPELDPRLFSYNSKHGWCTSCVGTGLQLGARAAQALDDSQQTAARRTAAANSPAYEGEAKVCTQCDGQRLNRVARAVRWRDKSIAELASLPVSDAHTFFTGLVARGRDGEIARDVLSEIRGRLEFLEEVGLGYLALDRAAPTLSGGEAQRIRLAAQLGSNLQGVCYVLDEPTIGLHPRDNQILLDALATPGRQGQHAGGGRA